MKPVSDYQITVKELQKNVKDRITDVYTEGDVTIIQIPNGKVKIMPNNKKPQPKYSLKNGGRKTKYVCPQRTENKKGSNKYASRKSTNRQSSK